MTGTKVDQAIAVTASLRRFLVLGHVIKTIQTIQFQLSSIEFPQKA